MIRSMTGYGQARWQGEGVAVWVEVRSVNGRNFKLSTRMPHEFGAAELDFEKRIRKQLSRGSVNLTIRLELTGARAARPINTDALAAYIRQLRSVADALSTPVTLGADALFELPGVLDTDEIAPADQEWLLARMTETLDRALAELGRMREAEGQNLRDELLRHTEAVERLVAQIEAGQADAMAQYAERLTARVNRLLAKSELTVTEGDLAREIAIYADRASIAEEAARLRSHAEQLREALDKAKPVGRRLEFLGQEMHREANTMGAKTADVALGRLVVDLQGEVGKIREQVLNVE